MADGYQTKNRRTAFENTRFHVYADHISDGRGLEVEDYLVVAPKVTGERLITGVVILPVVGDKIGLLRMYRHALSETFWEAPRGFLDPGEVPAVSARREMEEETGLTCEIEDVVVLGTMVQEASTLAARVALFVAKDCRPTTKGEVHHELGLEDFRLFDKSEVAEMVASSEIEDACTLLAYYRWMSAID